MSVAGPAITPSLPPQNNNAAPTTTTTSSSKNKNDEPSVDDTIAITPTSQQQQHAQLHISMEQAAEHADRKSSSSSLSISFGGNGPSDNNHTSTPDSSSSSSSSENVAVDPRFVMPKCELPPAHEFRPVETFVAAAILEQHQQKEDTIIARNYKGILEALRFKTNDLSLLKKILLAMRTSRNTMNLLTTTGAGASNNNNTHKHARLIHQIFRFNPFQQTTTMSKTGVASTTTAAVAAKEDVTSNNNNIDMGLVDAHLTLVVALVSANSVFLVPATTALWKLLNSDIHIASEERRQRLHAALATIVRLCPKGRTEIFPIVSTNCPFRTRPETELSWYYQQCVHVLQYVPGIEGRVLEMLIEKSLEMDVEIKINDGGQAMIDQEQDRDDDGAEDIFQLDLEEDETKVSETVVLPTGVTVDEMADKLDSLMLLIFDYVDQKMKVNPAGAFGLYQVIFRAFESSILITHKSKFVQFLLLNLCGLEAQASATTTTTTTEPLLLYREYAAKLIDVVLDPYRATVTRQTGACYLASFVSRAVFVCPETICESVNALLRWAEAYMNSLGSLSIHAADVRNQCSLHSLFYTVCQSAFYIMCFRGADAIQFYSEALSRTGEETYDEPERIDIGGEKWTKLCSHPLQPLRWCLESVRSEFLAVSKVFGLIDDKVLKQLLSEEVSVSKSVLQRKRRVSNIMTPVTMEKERQSGGVGGLGRGTNPLDSFFPFDPYLLHRSNRYIEPFYNHWKGSITYELMTDLRDNDTAFGDMDDNSVDSQTEDNGSVSGKDSDSDGDDDDGGGDPDPNRRPDDGFRPMSLASNAASVSTASTIPEDDEEDDEAADGRSTKEAWSSTAKRSRAPSIENGSW